MSDPVEVHILGEPEKSDPAGLTSIHGRIHCAATDGYQTGENEVENIALDNFIKTLAEVAISVVKRKGEQNG